MEAWRSCQLTTVCTSHRWHWISGKQWGPKIQLQVPFPEIFDFHFKHLCCLYDVALWSTWDHRVDAPLMTATTLDMPSIILFILLVSVQERLKKTWREFMDKNGRLLQTLASMPKWESVLCACLFGRLSELTFHKKWQLRLQERWDNTSCFWLDRTQSPCQPLVVISCF